jgi:Tol biopolymer transport system component
VGLKRASVVGHRPFHRLLVRASNLVRGDTNHATLHGIDIFVRDRRTHTTRLVSVQTNGRQFFDSVTPDISPNGRFVVFEEGDICCNFMRIRWRDRLTRQTRLVSLPSGGSNLGPSVSANGRYVVYTSSTPLPGEDPNDESSDALLADIRLGTTNYAALSSTGAKAPPDFGSVISDDGRWIVFGSDSDTVVPGDTNRVGDVFIHHR